MSWPTCDDTSVQACHAWIPFFFAWPVRMCPVMRITSSFACLPQILFVIFWWWKAAQCNLRADVCELLNRHWLLLRRFSPGYHTRSDFDEEYITRQISQARPVCAPRCITRWRPITFSHKGAILATWQWFMFELEWRAACCQAFPDSNKAQMWLKLKYKLNAHIVCK